MVGGKRAGAGRKPGSLSKKSREIAEKAAQQGLTPLEVMLDVMRKSHQEGNMEQALDAAKGAAPYMHPRLASVELAGKEDQPIKMIVTWANENKK